MLIDEIRERLAHNDPWYIWDRSANCEVLESTTIDEGRWTRRVRLIVRRGLEIVAVEYDEGLTEYQDVDDVAGEVYYVKPEVVTKIEYVRAD